MSNSVASAENFLHPQVKRGNSQFHTGELIDNSFHVRLPGAHMDTWDTWRKPHPETNLQRKFMHTHTHKCTCTYRQERKTKQREESDRKWHVITGGPEDLDKKHAGLILRCSQ